MLKKVSFLKIFLVFAFLFATLANNSHLIEFCLDGCEENTIEASQHTHLEGESIVFSESDHDNHPNETNHYSHDCHHHLSFLSQSVPTADLNPAAKTSFIYKNLVSNPHPHALVFPPII